MPCFFMKLIVYLVGLVTLLAAAGCEWDEHHHGRGGDYDGYSRGYGHEAYPYGDNPVNRDWPHREYHN